MRHAQAKLLHELTLALETRPQLAGVRVSHAECVREHNYDLVVIVEGLAGDVPLRVKPDGTVLDVVGVEISFDAILEAVATGWKPLEERTPTPAQLAQALNESGIAAMAFHAGGGVMTVTVYESRERMLADQYGYRLMLGCTAGEWGADVFDGKQEHTHSITTTAKTLSQLVRWVDELLTGTLRLP